MNREDYQKVKQIFQSALDITPGERSDFLDKHCQDNKDLRREVEKLFDSLESGYLEEPAIGRMADAFASKELEGGQVVGHHKIIKKIGAGGMGEVYLAEDNKLDRKVAIKFLNEEFAQDADKLRRFVQEAKAVSALNHPNILTVYEIGEADGKNYIATELIQGETLRQRLHDEPLNLRDIFDVALQIAAALNAAHDAGIVHRDIKPENIMLRDDGFVKVLDFGLAKLIERKGEREKGRKGEEEDTLIAMSPHLPVSPSPLLTNPGMVMGTVAYMSPEQARGKEVDARSDIWSLGIVVYEMLCGRTPFAGETTNDSIAAILAKEPAPLDENTPKELQRIIRKSLQKKADERYQTVKDFLLDVKDLKHELEFSEELERLQMPHSFGSSDVSTAQVSENPTATNSGAISTQNITNSSSLEYAVTQAKSHKLATAIIGIVLLSIISAIAYFGFFAKSTNQIESIAVMPFVNESGNADVEYLSDGMTETLIRNLSQIPNLNIKARSTVFFYKGKEITPKKIGEDLGVQAVLLGRVVQRGDDLKLSLELVNTQTQDVIWSETYNRKQADLVKLQSEIARDVSDKLKTKLSGADTAKIAKNTTVNPEAYQLYLQGRFFWNKRTGEDIKKALELFKAANEKDPNYALAYAGIADCYFLMPEYLGTPPNEAYPQAKANAEKAIQLDESLAEPHATLGYVNYLSRNYAEAEKEFKRSIELNPNYPTARHWYYRFLESQNRKDEAMAEIKRAVELDPLSIVIIVNLAQAYQARDDFDAAIEVLQKAVSLSPDSVISYKNLALAYLGKGLNAEALASAQKAVELSKRTHIALRTLGEVYIKTGKRTEALVIIKELEDKYAKKESWAASVAYLYMLLGDNEKAIVWSEKAFTAKEAEATPASLKNNKDAQALREDPRYKAMLKRLGLSE